MTNPTLFQVNANYSSFSTNTVSGTVKFRAVVGQGDVVTGLSFDSPQGFLNSWIEGRIINGILCATDGTPGVPLLSSAGLDLEGGLYYRATFNDIDGFDTPKDVVFAASTDSTDLNLLSVTPAPSVGQGS